MTTTSLRKKVVNRLSSRGGSRGSWRANNTARLRPVARRTRAQYCDDSLLHGQNRQVPTPCTNTCPIHVHVRTHTHMFTHCPNKPNAAENSRQKQDRETSEGVPPAGGGATAAPPGEKRKGCPITLKATAHVQAQDPDWAANQNKIECHRQQCGSTTKAWLPTSRMPASARPSMQKKEA